MLRWAPLLFAAACSLTKTTPDADVCAMPPADEASCATDSDCTTVLDGCFCGAQPVVGVAKTHASEAQACQTAAAMHCGLGCANEPGFTAQDGNHADSTAMISVHCNAQRTCTTTVP